MVRKNKKHILLALVLTLMLAFGTVGVYAETAEGDVPATVDTTVEKAEAPAEEDIAPIAEDNGIFKANGSTTMDELINVANGTTLNVIEKYKGIEF